MSAEQLIGEFFLLKSLLVGLPFEIDSITVILPDGLTLILE